MKNLIIYVCIHESIAYNYLCYDSLKSTSRQTIPGSELVGCSIVFTSTLIKEKIYIKKSYRYVCNKIVYLPQTPTPYTQLGWTWVGIDYKLYYYTYLVYCNYIGFSIYLQLIIPLQGLEWFSTSLEFLLSSPESSIEKERTKESNEEYLHLHSILVREKRLENQKMHMRFLQTKNF